MQNVLLYCRAGFENECARDFTEQAREMGVVGTCAFDVNHAYVLFRPPPGTGGERLMQKLDFKNLVFTRQWFGVHAFLTALSRGDRVAPIAAVCSEMAGEFAELVVETADAADSNKLQPLCRGLLPHLQRALQQSGKYNPKASRRLHVCFFSTDHVAVGYSYLQNSSRWPTGIPRLRRWPNAPSRSAQKLEEALLFFFEEHERGRLLRPGMRAVDLGAAPGGWSWIMAGRGLYVTAVDNGRLAKSAMESGMVEHVAADGFSYRPRRPVDWLLCDMVEKPRRVADLVGQWFVRHDCRQAIFNLKLPMKSRYDEYILCRDMLLGYLRKSQQKTMLVHAIHARQLYYDRDEITLWVACRGTNNG